VRRELARNFLFPQRLLLSHFQMRETPHAQNNTQLICIFATRVAAHCGILFSSEKQNKTRHKPFFQNREILNDVSAVYIYPLN
jgi:hypothetical protein